MKSKYFFILFLLLGISIGLYASRNENGVVKNDSVSNDTIKYPSSTVKWYSERQLANGVTAEPNYIDTILRGFHKYDFTYREKPFFAHKGYAGHASHNLISEPKPSSLGFSYLKDDIYKGNLFSHNKIKFYRPEHVYTNLFYATGGELEQLFYALHSQRLSEQAVLTVKYQKNRTKGDFSRLESDNTNFYSSFDYTGKNERYQLLGSFVWNKMQNQESGGLRNYEAFEENEARDSVILLNADGRYRETAFNINNYYQIGFHKNNINEKDTISKFVNLGKLSHQFSYNRRSYIFNEDAIPYAGYFEGHPMIDSMPTYDSTMIHNISNRIGYSNYRNAIEKNIFPLFFNIYIEHNYFDIKHPFELENQFNQFTQGGNIHTDKNKLLSFKGRYNYIFGGYNDEDFSVSVNAKLGEFGERKHWFEFNASYYNKESPYIMSDYFSNYICWVNNFDKSKIANAGFTYGNSLLSVDLDAYQLTNWHYFNKEAIPEQADDSFLVTSAGIKSNINFGVFGFYNNIIYQYFTDDSYEQFPELVSYHSLYADFALFDKALYTHIGIDAKYNSSYHPQSYMPVHKQFYFQDDYRTPQTIILNAFLNIKISKARLFVKWKNLGASIWDQPPIYKIPYYPLPPLLDDGFRSEFRFGVSWMFFD